MAIYLVTVALGPVQSLIEAARRTRDLWCGSWLLSEAARAAAYVFHKKQPGCLIFPCPDNPDIELKPNNKPGDAANISNIVRAQIQSDDIAQVKELCQQAKQAATDRLEEFCDWAQASVSKLPLHEKLWNDQKSDILESFAAWTEITNSDYKTAFTKLNKISVARKATRNFIPAAINSNGNGYSIPKSSLDGARESVLNLPHNKRNSPQYKTALRKIGLGKGEELDALALTKRCAGDIEQFTAYSRIAADPWIETLSSSQQTSICFAYEPLIKAQLATRVTGNQSIYCKVPFDAQLLYDFRLANALSSQDLDDNDHNLLVKLREELIIIQRNEGKPVPYAVILKADGDRMGKLLASAQKAEDSRDISKALHEFASAVREIVRNHRGHAIYAGGDDVLALLPLPNALTCAKELSIEFSNKLTPIAKRLNTLTNEYPTLSVGLGVGHLMEPLGSLRDRADHAEKLAKNSGRNALAIILGIRSGGENQWHAKWNDIAKFDALDTFIKGFREQQLPSRIAYGLRAIDLRLLRLVWLREQNDDSAKNIRRSEVNLMLDRARVAGGNKKIDKDLRDLIQQRLTQESLQQLAETLIIARWFAARVDSDLEK